MIPSYSNSTIEQRQEVERFIGSNILAQCTSMVDEMIKNNMFQEDEILNDGPRNEDGDLDPEGEYYSETLEWYMITTYLARLLEERCVVIAKFQDHWPVFWGRSTSGQSIILDDVLWQIVFKDIPYEMAKWKESYSCSV